MATAKSAQETEATTNSAPQQPANEQSTAEAVEQLRDATTQLYKALNTLGGASADTAKAQLQQGQQKARVLGSQAEDRLREHPLITVGVAFTAGWLVSRWMQR